jgi:predicted transcriptional regulator of viral defense system
MVFLLYNRFMTDDPYAKYKKIFTESNGILRASTAIELGIPKHILYQMVEKGELVREAQGIYRLDETGPLGNPDSVQISLRVPRAVICLISALYFHELTTQIPHQVHIALPRDVKTPKVDYPPIKAFHFSGESYHSGIEEHTLDGVRVKIYSKEKTVADCFKFRNKIGVNIALEALKDYLNQPRPNIQLIMDYARVNRVEKIMRPYLESLV